MNPTVGVRPRGKVPEALRGLMFRKDSSQPGGGIFVAAERPSGDYSDLPKGTIVLKGDSLGQGVAKDVNVRGEQFGASCHVWGLMILSLDGADDFVVFDGQLYASF